MIKSWLYSMAGLLGFLLGSYLLFTYGLPIVLPFVIALILAELIEPIVGLITYKEKVPRALAVALVLLALVGFVTMVVTAVIAQLTIEIRSAIDQAPSLYKEVVALGERLSQSFGAFHASLPTSIKALLPDQDSTKVTDWLTAQLPGFLAALGAVGGLPILLANLLVAIIATFFISRDRTQIGTFLLSLFPEGWRQQIRRVKVDVWSSTMGYAKAQMMLILLTMIQTIIGLALIGSNYAVTMGIVVGLVDVLPLLGPAAIFVPWIAYSFLVGSKLFGVKLLILFALVAGVRQMLEAKVIGDQVGLHPLAILFSIFVGFQFFGAIGFVVGPLLAILLNAMIQSGLLPIFQDEPPK